MYTTELNLLLGRKFWGLGDWIMCMSVVRMINRQRPDINVHFNVTYIPSLMVEVLHSFNVSLTPVCMPTRSNYGMIVDHLVYRAPYTDKHLIANMLDVLNDQFKLGLQYNISQHAQYVLVPPEGLTQLTDYILMSSVGASNSAHKEWGAHRFDELAGLLKAAGIPVIQIGLKGDPLLANATERYFQLSLADLAALVKGSRYVVSLENGLSHLAGHMRHRCCTLYLHRGTRPVHTWYPNQMALAGDVMEPQYVFDTLTNGRQLTRVI